LVDEIILRLVRITLRIKFSFHSYFHFISSITLKFCTLQIFPQYMRLFSFHPQNADTGETHG